MRVVIRRTSRFKETKVQNLFNAKVESLQHHKRTISMLTFPLGNIYLSIFSLFCFVTQHMSDLLSLYWALDRFIRDPKFIPGGRTNQVSLTFLKHYLTYCTTKLYDMIDISSASYS